jgi:predicted kinase
MYPAQMTTAHGSAAERAVFNALRSKLPDDFFCYHSKQLLRLGPRGARLGEIDFIVLHRELGLLVLEVKGGGLERDGSGNWHAVASDGSRQRLRQDPFAQARTNCHALMDLLRQRLGSVLPDWQGQVPLPFGHAVFLPDVEVRRGDMVPSGTARELLLDIRALDDPLGAIRRAMKVWVRGRQPVPAREFKRFRRRVLHPALSLVPSLGSLFRRDEELLKHLTEEQTHFLNQARDVPRARVTGPAGTGKTVLAVELARRFAAQGRRTCLICYNRPLAEDVQARVDADEHDDRLLVATFHQLCRRAARALGRSFEVPTDEDEQETFWREQAPEYLAQAADEGQLRFDALLVDEAQDLETEWWVPLVTVVPDDGALWVFYDPQQDIYSRSSSMPSGLVSFTLTRNCRATFHLRQLCDRIADVEDRGQARAPEGRPHEVIRYGSAEDLRTRLDERVSRLCSREGLHPSQIVILAPHTQKNTSLAGVDKVGGQSLVDSRQEKGILFSTARRFKGLESDVVILIDQDPQDPACTAVHRYVAASRARHLLVVFSRGEWG